MSEWPDGLSIGPIRQWPGELTPAGQRKTSPFRRKTATFPFTAPMPLASTLELLDRELFTLGARDREMLVAFAPGDFRLDGMPRAQARSEHPGVILSFTTKLGDLSYPCDTFTTWQDNLRAIALALEALRKVDRYGVTKHGEQYRGFMAIEASTAVPAGFRSADEAISFIHSVIPDDWTTIPHATSATELKVIIHQAQRATHPDLGGDSADFQRVTLAEQYLKQNGHLA